MRYVRFLAFTGLMSWLAWLTVLGLAWLFDATLMVGLLAAKGVSWSVLLLQLCYRPRRVRRFWSEVGHAIAGR
jgi:hypothetical protein